MTEAKKMSNRLKQTWAKTNSGNWDVIEGVLRSAKKMIDSGNFDSELIDVYITIYEAFNNEFGGRSHG